MAERQVGKNKNKKDFVVCGNKRTKHGGKNQIKPMSLMRMVSEI